MKRPSPTPGNVLTAAAWMGGALVSFMAMAIGGRELAAELSTFQILFFRGLVGLIVMSLVLSRAGWGLLRTSKIRLHALRNLAHFGGQFGWFYGLAFIPLAEVFAIEFTAPIWTAILAAIVLGERITPPRIAAIAFGVAGLLLILRPGMQTIQPATLAVLAGALSFAVAHIVTRKLTRTEPTLSILFYMIVMQLAMGAVPAFLDWTVPSPAMWPWLLTVGLTALSAHYCLTRALSLADASVVVPMDFLRLPLIALVGALFYEEPLDILVLAGAGLMLLGNWINLSAERRRLRTHA